jgi:hypothetical protein
MEALKIVAGAVLAAVLYGMVHDQVTIRVCLEYFTVFHPPVFRTHNPTLLALGWGVIATWWMGVILGTLLAIAARAGSPPRVSARELGPKVLKLLAVMGVCALIAGVTGYFVTGAMGGDNFYRRLQADLWAHSASYFVGAIGSVGLCVRTAIVRKRLSGVDLQVPGTSR